MCHYEYYLRVNVYHYRHHLRNPGRSRHCHGSSTTLKNSRPHVHFRLQGNTYTYPMQGMWLSGQHYHLRSVVALNHVPQSKCRHTSTECLLVVPECVSYERYSHFHHHHRGSYGYDSILPVLTLLVVGNKRVSIDVDTDAVASFDC